MNNQTVWLVIEHCEAKRRTGRGYVVRPSSDISGNAAADTYNYGGIEPVIAYYSRARAINHAERMNGTVQCEIPA